MAGLNRKRSSKVEEWNADLWYREFFGTCSLPEEDAENYAVIFAQNGMQWDMLQLLTKELLKEMRITKVGHILAILRSAQKLSSEEQRSEICHSPKPTVQSKVVNLKSVVNLKDSRTRKPNEVGGVKRDVSGVKRSLPEEGPTLSVKMPNKMKVIVSQPNSPDKGPSIIRTLGREESVEVSSSTEKKSVFARLGMSYDPGASCSTMSPMPAAGILKKNPSLTGKGPLKFPKKGREPRRCVSPNSLNQNPSSFLSRSRSPVIPSTPTTPVILRSPVVSAVKPTAIEPSFHVTVNRPLTNPLVNKIANSASPHNKQFQEGRSSVVSVANRGNNRNHQFMNRSGSSIANKDKNLYGSMAADQMELSKGKMQVGLGMEKDNMKFRLGNRPDWNTSEIDEKKRVSFGYVRTKEIPALPGTQPVNQSPGIGNPLLSRRYYTGSIAFGTAKRLS